QQPCLRPRTGEKGEAQRQVMRKARGHGEDRVSGDGGGLRAASEVLVTVELIDPPRRRAAGGDQRRDAVLAQHAVDSLGARKTQSLLASIAVCLSRQAARLHGLFEKLLPEVRHLLRRVFPVPADDVGEALDGQAAPSTEVAIEAVFELAEQDRVLGVGLPKLLEGGGLDLDQDGAAILERRERFLVT